jgi:hypothetical protein
VPKAHVFVGDVRDQNIIVIAVATPARVGKHLLGRVWPANLRRRKPCPPARGREDGAVIDQASRNPFMTKLPTSVSNHRHFSKRPKCVRWSAFAGQRSAKVCASFMAENIKLFRVIAQSYSCGSRQYSKRWRNCVQQLQTFTRTQLQHQRSPWRPRGDGLDRRRIVVWLSIPRKRKNGAGRCSAGLSQWHLLLAESFRQQRTLTGSGT